MDRKRDMVDIKCSAAWAVRVNSKVADSVKKIVVTQHSEQNGIESRDSRR